MNDILVSDTLIFMSDSAYFTYLSSLVCFCSIIWLREPVTSVIERHIGITSYQDLLLGLPLWFLVGSVTKVCFSFFLSCRTSGCLQQRTLFEPPTCLNHSPMCYYNPVVPQALATVVHIENCKFKVSFKNTALSPSWGHYMMFPLYKDFQFSLHKSTSSYRRRTWFYQADQVLCWPCSDKAIYASYKTFNYYA